jgi:bacterioferritin-associated ferredoxin
MTNDEPLCLCFHVTRRKVWNFLRVQRPVRASQLSECFGAGTGCGWCRPFLEQMFRQWKSGDPQRLEFPEARDYARQRTCYVQQGGGTPPPGAVPIDDPAEDPNRLRKDLDP